MFLLVINSFPTKKNSLDFHRRETQRSVGQSIWSRLKCHVGSVKKLGLFFETTPVS